MSRKPSRHARQQRSCNKRRFRDHGEAIQALRTLNATSSRQTVPHRAYECTRCGGWHLTSREDRS